MADAREMSELTGAEFLPGGALRGQTLGPYLLVERLGGGAMATVYRAVDQRTGRAVAIKVLRPDADAIMRERFRREAETHSNLNHPNIVQILDVGQVPETGLTYIAMELVDGPNLSEVMEEVLRLSPADAARILEPIASALDYACRQGVIHRDVKPSNVLLRKVHDDTPNAVRIEGLDVPVLPLLSDFGIARALDAPELTSVGRTIGTPTYMSPEQCADSHEIDGRSDLYSLGAVFYRCVVGRPPFSGTTTQILHAHVYDPLTIPDEVMAQLPPAAIDVLVRTLAKDPSLRYKDGSALTADLHRLLLPSAVGGAPNGASDAAEDDLTATMHTLPALPAMQVLAGQTVLVPGPDPLPNTAVTPVAALTTVPSGAVTTQGGTVAPVYIPAEPPPPPRVVTTLPNSFERRPRRRWLGAVAGGLLAALVLILGGGLALNLLPAELVGSIPAAPTAVAVTTTDPNDGGTNSGATAVAVLPQTPPAVNPDSNVSGDPQVSSGTGQGPDRTDPATPANGGEGLAPPATNTATQPGGSENPPSTSGDDLAVDPTALPVPTPQGDLASYWTEAEMAIEDGDWENALDYINVARRIDPRYRGARGDEMIFESRIGAAAGAIAAGEFDAALEHLDAALALRPDADRVAKIRQELQTLVAPGTLNIAVARWSLATALVPYAQELFDAQKPCAAADQLRAASTLTVAQSSAKLLAEMEAACEKARRDALSRRRLGVLSGRLLYSTQSGESYDIFRAGAALDASSSLLIAGGTQPSRQQRSNVIAFHSTQEGGQGIALYDVAAGLPADRRSVQLTTSPGDARDAPPSWSADDRHLVYSSTDGTGRSRILRIEVGGGDAIELGAGRDPAWSPEQDRIVFNGVDEQGGQPGLWLMNGDGSERARLTDNGNDIRPVWTPNGNSVVFMSSRDGNWEVYRLNLLTGDLTRLTNHPAQDGLPSVSPDGKWVAFASDRGGFWRIWVTPLDGGDAQPLITIEGVLTNWLEHAIQWIP
jgi:serine/threonine-protein kinase